MNIYTQQSWPTSGSQLSTTASFLRETIIHLLQQKQSSCEGPLTESECLSSLKNMADGKTPGTDGLPAEFYLVFWFDILGVLVAELNFA